MIEYRNEVFNMTVVTLGGFVGKICSRLGPLLEESEGKKYQKKLKMLKYY